MTDSENKLIEKTTPTDYRIHELIKSRWSPRVFAETPVTSIDLYTLFEAGRWAPSSNNLQPWKIVYGIKGSESYDKIFECLDEFNQGWAKDAPALLITAFKKTNPEGKENFHALHDLGLFMGNVCIQAQSMGIAVHQMAGIDHEKAHKDFSFPENHHVATAVALGFYGGNPESLPDDLKKQELKELRERKDQEEFVFNGEYVERADLE